MSGDSHNLKFSECFTYHHEDSWPSAMKHSEIRNLSQVFVGNTDRLFSIAVVGPYMLEWGRWWILIDTQAWWNITRSFPVIPKHERPPELEAAIRLERVKISKENIHGRPADWQSAAKTMDMILTKNDGESIRPGIEATLASMLGWAFMAFESLATDLWVTLINLGDKKYAESVLGMPISGTRDDHKEVNVQFKSISVSELRRYEYDLSQKMGQLLKDQGKVHFESVNNIKKAYESAFDKKVETCFPSEAWRQVRLLESIRNLYAHRGGIVDVEFKNQVDDLPEFSSLELKKPFPIDGEMCAKLADAAICIGRSLAFFADGILSPGEENASSAASPSS